MKRLTIHSSLYLRFLIGLVKDPALSAAVEREALIHKDICRVHMEEDYYSLRSKVTTLVGPSKLTKL